ncbi:MAG: hypothetical protein ABI142_07005, partial [Bryocella sp.]
KLVNADLSERYPSFWAYQPIRAEAIHSLHRVLMQNTVTGNTAVINRPLAKLAITLPATVHMHDWWVAVLAAAFGDATPIYQQLVLYRQHDANVLGIVPEGHAKPGSKRYHHHPARLAAWEAAANMARALLAAYGDRLRPAQRRTAERFVAIDTSTSAFARVANFLALRLYLFAGLRSTLAMLWLIADLPAARRSIRGA